MESYFVLFLSFLVALGIAVLVPNINVVTNRFLKLDSKNKEKFLPYECGIPSVSPLKGRYFAFFYVLALIFLLFDLETVFLFPWAVAFKSLGILGFVESFIFITILLIGFLYAVAKGVLKWE